MFDQRVDRLRMTSLAHVFRCSSDEYLVGFLRAVDVVHGSKGWERIAVERFQIAKQTFKLEEYLSAAAELSVQHHLSSCPLVYALAAEKQVCPPKDVDCFYSINGVDVALDVKCAHKPVQAENADLHMGTLGRLPPRARADLDDLAKQFAAAPEPKIAGKLQNKDNTCRDFLVSCHGKFDPSSGPRNFNIAWFGCEGAFDMNSWRCHLLGRQGLFTRESFHPRTAFSLVDCVMLSNLKDVHRHRRANATWDLQNVFMLPILNRYSRRASLTCDIALEPFDHFLRRFTNFRRQSSPGIDDSILDAVSLIGFPFEAMTPDERIRYFGSEEVVQNPYD